MSDRLTLYTNPMSRGQIARWMIEETGADYETVILEYGTTMKAPEYLSINPMGKVPAIRHGKTVITEVAAICAYLADAFPHAGLAPPINARGDYYRWLFFTSGSYEAALTAKSLGLEPTPEQQMFAGFGSLENVLRTLEKLLTERDFIAADYFTAADLYLGAQIDFGLSFKTLEPRDAFVAYQARTTNREAYKRAKTIDNDLIAKQQS